METPSRPNNSEPETVAITDRDIVYECPHCGKSHVVDQTAAGMIIDCVQCAQQVIVPLPPEPTVPVALLEELRSMRSQVALLQQQGNIVVRRLAQMPAPTSSPTVPAEWQLRMAEVEYANDTLRAELDGLRAEVLGARIAALRSPQPLPPSTVSSPAGPPPRGERVAAVPTKLSARDEEVADVVRRLRRELADLRADNHRILTQRGQPPVAVPAAPTAPAITPVTISAPTVPLPAVEPAPTRHATRLPRMARVSGRRVASRSEKWLLWSSCIIAAIWVAVLVYIRVDSQAKQATNLRPLQNSATGSPPTNQATEPDPAAPPKAAAPATAAPALTPSSARERVVVLLRKGDTAAALPELEKIVSAQPDDHEMRGLYAYSLCELGRHHEATEEYRKALRQSPHDNRLANNLAAILATHPEPALRNGAEALKLAEAACTATGFKDPNYLDTLAAAHAEVGQFPQAVQVASQALEIAGRLRKTALKKEILTRLEWYKMGLPYHVPARALQAQAR